MADLSGRSLGRYHLLEKLGKGGMAVVYKAHDTHLERDVAVKVIRRDAFAPNQLERILKRFEREAKALARLQHPNIVPVIDYGEHDGMPYLVMAYLSGGALKDRIGPPMPWREAARMLVPIAQALEVAHEQNLIHRDVKPSNILLTQKGQPMLTDFGIAKILDTDEGQTLTGTGVGVGTPGYMAPEQWTGKTVPQSDIYSLGVVLYEMLAGRKPYLADTPAEVLLKQAGEPLPAPSKFVTGLPGPVEQVILKALEKNPENRYQTMTAFGAALEKLAVLPESQPKEKNVAVAAGDGGSQETIDSLEASTVKQLPSMTAVTGRTAAVPQDPTNGPLLKRLAGLALLVLVVAGIASAVSVLSGAGSQLAESEGQTSTLAESFTPMVTDIPSMTNTPEIIPSPQLGSTQVREKDNMLMVFVPAGEFSMGSMNGDPDEQPVHQVYLDGFWIDQLEVTNAMMTLCFQAGICDAPDSWSYPSDGYADHPVVLVDRKKAQKYCEWVGGRLPTEAEWEKAARGTDGRTYPWGDSLPDCGIANFKGCTAAAESSAVGIHPDNISPYGVMDMAGNVSEWVSDLYLSNYYASSPSSNPTGPGSSEFQLVRGGSWNSEVEDLRGQNRIRTERNFSSGSDIGFRCVVPVSTSPISSSPVSTVASGLVSIEDEFNDPSLFTSLDPDVYISGGSANWNVSRSDGMQFLYRDIPSFSGNVSLEIIGEVNAADNNCGGMIGIGDKLGGGIAISYGFFGGGCPQNGYLIDAWKGISLDHSMAGCTFVDTWLWVDRATPYTARLELKGGLANLTVPNVGTVTGTTTYQGPYSVLWVGLEGDGDWPSCSGKFDSVRVNQIP